MRNREIHLCQRCFLPRSSSSKKKRVYDTSEYVGHRNHPLRERIQHPPAQRTGYPPCTLPFPEPFSSFSRRRSLPHVGPATGPLHFPQGRSGPPAHLTRFPSPMEWRTPGFRPDVASHNGKGPPVKRSQLTIAGGLKRAVSLRTEESLSAGGDRFI